MSPFHLSLYIFPFLGTQMWMHACRSSTILFHLCTIGTMCALGSTNCFHVTCLRCLHLMSTKTSCYSQLPCHCHNVWSPLNVDPHPAPPFVAMEFPTYSKKFVVVLLCVLQVSGNNGNERWNEDGTNCVTTLERIMLQWWSGRTHEVDNLSTLCINS